jgi:hypothetical protein
MVATGANIKSIGYSTSSCRIARLYARRNILTTVTLVLICSVQKGRRRHSIRVRDGELVV